MTDTSDDPFFMLRKLRNGSFGDWTYLRFRAANEIERLQRELAEAKDQCDMARVNLNIAITEADKAVKALREAMNRLQADAQRYRWLRDNRVIKLDYGTPNPRNLDEMIDAALRGEGK